jgi:hypothetical protein
MKQSHVGGAFHSLHISETSLVKMFGWAIDGRSHDSPSFDVLQLYLIVDPTSWLTLNQASAKRKVLLLPPHFNSSPGRFVSAIELRLESFVYTNNHAVIVLPAQQSNAINIDLEASLASDKIGVTGIPYVGRHYWCAK